MRITKKNTIFIMLSFEGPDVYSMAGGLGSRVTFMTEALANMGFTVHHFFVGSPSQPSKEYRYDDKLVLHRWCQWISKYHLGGVYEGEEEKLADFTASLPPYLVDDIIMPSIKQNRHVVILAEEWHTAAAMCSINDLLNKHDIRNSVVMFWNANNTYSFNRIEWDNFCSCTTITTVSKYMKQIMQGMNVSAMVIPNGIPMTILVNPKEGHVSSLQDIFAERQLFSKVARWHYDKGWETTINAIKMLKQQGKKPVLLARGGIESYQDGVFGLAKSLDLKVKDVYLAGDIEEHYRRALVDEDFDAYFEALSQIDDADIVNLQFPIPSPFLQIIYRASNIVIANSIHEPFGLVPLEAMAAGAVVMCGSSGEDYAIHMYNAIVLDTYAPEEILFYIEMLRDNRSKYKAISVAAQQTAERWSWENVISILLSKLEFQGYMQQIATPEFQ